MRSPVPRIVDASITRPWTTVIVMLLLTALSLGIVATRFAMTTDTGALISPNIDWRRQERAMETAFPQLRDVMLIVVDGQTPELAEDGAARLSQQLASDHRHFRGVSRPDGGDFFAREGLLFASAAEVRQSTAALIEAQPLLGPLAADPSLHGVATALLTILDGVEQGSATLKQIDAPMRALTTVIDRTLAGKPAFFSWQALFSVGTSRLAPPRRRLVLAQPILDHTDLQPGAAASHAVDQATRLLALDAAHGVRVRLTGEVPLADEEFATLEDNIGVVAAVMLFAMLATLWLATRSARLVAAIMVTTITGLIVTTAVGLLVVGRLNLISVAFIPLFVGLGVDFGIQICLRFNAERADGVAPADAMRRAGHALGASLLLAAGAVFLGFGAFLPTAYVGIAELGIIAGMGMVVALTLSITLLPVLVLLLRPDRPRGETGLAMLAPAGAWLEAHRRAVIWTFVVSMLVSIALLPWITFDFNPLHLRDPNAPAMRTLADLTRDPERTPNTIDVMAPNTSAAATLTRRLAALPEVAEVVSLDSFIPDDQPVKLAIIGDAQMLLDLTLNPFDEMPQSSVANTQEALATVAGRLRVAASAGGRSPAEDARRLAEAFERLARASPVALELVAKRITRPLDVMLDQVGAALQAEPITRETLPEVLRRDWETPDGRYRLMVFPRGNPDDATTMRRFRAAVAGVTPAISGLPVATQAAAATVAGAFVQAGIIAFLAVSILLLLVLRNAREVAFTLTPVILSIFLTLGTCVVIGQPINFANIIAFPLLFGVGVAFHIYFVMAWRGGAHGLLQSSLARAVLFSALATGTAFGSLWLSHHPGTASMGKILMISLAWTLVCALIFEPALLGPGRQDVDRMTRRE